LPALSRAKGCVPVIPISSGYLPTARQTGGQSRRIKLMRKSMQTKIFFNTVGNIPLCREDGGIL
jgi:hypothetical protein